MSSLNQTSSWVIVRLSDDKPICETFSIGTVSSINKNKYKAVPILEYLQSLNKGV